MTKEAPTEAQVEKIEFIQSVMFQFFKGQTEEDAERYIALYYSEAKKMAHKLGMSRKRKARNRFDGRPIRPKGL